MARTALRRRASATFRCPRAYTSQLRMELLEDRLAPVNGQWMAVFEGLPVGDNLSDQAQYGRNVLSAAGVPDEEVSVAAALDLSGTFLLRTPLDADERTLTAELQAVPGFVFVQDFEPPSPARAVTLNAPHKERSEAIHGPFDYDAFLRREVYGDVPDQSGPVDSGELANALVNNGAGASGTAFFTQSETTIVAFGNTVVVGFNDSGSNGTASNKFTGFARSTDGGNTFADGGTLPTNPNGDAGDPVLARNDTTGRLYFSTLQFSGSGIQMFRSDDNGQTWMAPTQAAPGKSGFQDKQWHVVDNFAGPGDGNVYLIVRDFGAGNGIYLFRSTDHGNTFGPNGGTFIASGNQGAYVTVGPDHAVYAFWWAGSTIQMRKSTDFGVTFGAPVVVASGLIGGTNGDLGLVGQNNGEGFNRTIRSNSFPHVAVNPVTGHLYATFNTRTSSAGTDKGDVYVVVSTNGGASWSPRIKVNDDTTTNDQWQPTIAVTPDGTKLGVFYYSRQEDTTTADGDPVNNQFKYYGRIGTIAGSTVTFATPSFAISDVPSKPEVGRDGVVNTTYMGDYDQAVATPGAFHVIWSDSRSLLPNGGGRSDPNVFYKKISLGLTVAATTPAAGSIVSAVPLDYVVNFSDPIDASTVQASDFMVTNDSGVPVASDLPPIISSTQVVFRYSVAPFSNQGPHTMAMAAGSVARLSDGNPLAAFSGTFNLDTTALAVTTTNPPVGGVFDLPAPFACVINFNEPINPATAGTDDLTLSQGTVTAATPIENPLVPGEYRSVRYTIGNVTTEGTLTITVGAGKLADTLGNPNPASFVGVYSVDVGTVAFPAPLAAKAPLGSLVYDPVASGAITPAGDTDSFTINVDPGQTITVIVRPTVGTLQPTVALTGPGVLASAAAPGLGQPVILQTVPTGLTTGSYTVTVGGVGTTTGSYTVQVVLNAAEELERNAGQPTNNTLATAQDLDPSFIGLGGSASRGAALGTVASSTDQDWYRFTLAAGDTATVALEGLNTTNVNVQFRDSTGALVATGIAGPTNLDRVISDFQATAGGTYYLVVSSTTPGATYDLVVTRNAAFDAEGNSSFAAGQYAGGARGALGHLVAGTGLVRVSSFTTALGTLVALGHDPATGNLFAHAQFTTQIAEYTPTGVEVPPRINRPGASSDEFDLDFFGEPVNLGGTTVPAGSLLVVNGWDSPETVRALNKDTGAILATLSVPGANGSVGATYHPGRDTLFLVDWSSDVIREVNPATGAVLATFSVVPGGSPSFDIFFGDMDVDPATGNLLLVSSSQQRIRVLAPTGGFVRDINVPLDVSGMSSIAVNDSNGDIWVGSTSGTVTRLAASSDDDWYSFAVNATTDILSIQTSTPAAGPGEFVNNLNPRIELYNPSGVLVASGTAMADGKNEQISHTATATGLYRLRVAAEGSTAGEYFVSVSGNTGTTQPPFQVTTTTPPNGANLVTRPTTYTVNFNDAYLATSVQASDLKVDGFSATAVSLLDGDTLVFTLPSTLGPDSTHVVTIDGGAILDVQGTPLSAFSATFILDNIAPRVTATSVAPNGSVAPGSVSYQVTFSEPMRVANLTTDDFSLRGNIRGVNYTAGSFSFNPAGTVLTLNYASLPDDNYTLTLVAGVSSGFNFTDTVGNALDGEFGGTFPSGNGIAGGNFVVGFNMDLAGAEAYPTPLAPKAPLGGLIYDPSLIRTIAFAGDTDSFTLNVDAGQTITVVVTPNTAALRPTVTLRDPSGADIGSATAAAAGQKALLQTAATTTGGTYTITVGGALSTTGLYTAQVILNAAQEAEGTLAGASNDTRATAQDLNGSFVTLKTAQARASRGAVLGQLGATASLVTNGSFETGNFSGWTTTTTGQPFQPWTVSGAGVGGGFGMLTTQPQDGTRVAWNGFDGAGPMEYRLHQDITLPAGGSPTLTWKDRLQWNFFTAGAAPRTYFVEVRNPSTNALLATLHSFSTGTTPVNVPQNTGWVTHTASLAAFAGSTVRLQFREVIPQSFTGPGQFELDAVSLAGASPEDWYSYTLGAGEAATVGLKALTGSAAGLSLQIFDGLGNPVPASSPSATNVDRLATFTAASAGTYYARVTNTSGSVDYSLLVTRNAAFDTEANDTFGTAQDITAVRGALGHVGGASGGTSVLYATGNGGQSLIRVNQATGVATTVGPFGFTDTYAAAFTPDGTLWTIVNGFSTSARLATVNLSTGAATPVGTSNWTGSPIIALEADGAGTLYAANWNGTLFTVNKTTGQLTPVGSMGLFNLMDFTFDNAGTLWAVDGNNGLFRVNTTTGAGTRVSTITGVTFGQQVMGLMVDPADGAFYATTWTSPNSPLYRLNPTTGVATAVGAGLGVNLPHGGDFSHGAGAVSTLTLSATDSGWWDNTGLHDDPNNNYVAGKFQTTRWGDFFVFDLASVSQPIATAQLQVFNPSNGFTSPDPSETYTLFDISTPIPSLRATGRGQVSIFNDLTGGTAFGSTTVTPASNGQIVTVNLNAAGVADLNTRLGGLAAVGGTITTLRADTFDEYLFGFTSGTETRQLVLTFAPPDDWYSINVTSTAHPLRLETSTPADGPGQFVNNLNPRIELYSPSNTLVASGTVGADGRNEFIQHTPLVTGTYRVRVRSEGGTSGEYFLGTNFLPVARNDSATTNEDTPVAVNVLANDSDPDGTLNPATVTIVSGPAKGSVSVNTTTGVVTYTPNPDSNGPDSFTYTMRDNDGALSNVATVSVAVAAVNDAPVAADNSYTTDEDTALPVSAPGVLDGDTDVDGDALAAVLVSGPAHGTLALNSDGSFTYTPHLNYFGTDSFTYKANDGQADSNVATVSLTINPVNDAPVAVADSIPPINEDTLLTVAAPGVLGNDTDVEGDALTAVLVSEPSHGTLTLSSNGGFTYTPHLNYFGTDSFTYKANDGALDSNVATVSLTINPVNDAPAVSPVPPEQSVQYSDPIAPVTITATDVDSNGSRLTITTSALPAGLSLELTSTTEGGPFPGVDPGARTWTISGIANVAPGDYTITARVSDNHPTDPKTTETTFTITVKPEDARAGYTGALFVSTSSVNDATAAISLQATVRDITAVTGDPTTDANAGVVTNARVTFRIYDDSTNALLATVAGVAVNLIDPNDPKVGVASATWEADLGNADGRTYRVVAEVTDYYTNGAQTDGDQTAIVTASRPLSNFVTGGGYLTPAASAGTYAADAGSKTRFGVNVKFNNQGTNLQGQISVRLTSGGRDYQVRSNALSSLVADPLTGHAEVVAKATLTDVTDPLNPVSLGGNLSLHLVVTDSGGSGTEDTIAVTLSRSGGELLFSTNWTGVRTVEQAIAAGDLQVHSSSSFLLGAGLSPTAAPADGPLTADAVQPLLARVIELWQLAGASPADIAAASGANVVVTDLPGSALGMASPGTVWLDVDGAGVGWFVDPTPADDSEFATPGDQGEQGRFDLLSVLAHEFGHLLGHDHHEEGVMSESLVTGVRVLPEDHDHAMGEDLPFAEPLEDEAPVAVPPATFLLAPGSATLPAGAPAPGQSAERPDAPASATPPERIAEATTASAFVPEAAEVAEPIWVALDPLLDPDGLK